LQGISIDFPLNVYASLLYFSDVGPIFSDRRFFHGPEIVTYPAQPEALISVIKSCAWLIEYYEHRGVAPEALQAFRETMDKAANNLTALTSPVGSEVNCDSTTLPSRVH
jgi:hypothetical protein